MPAGFVPRNSDQGRSRQIQPKKPTDGSRPSSKDQLRPCPSKPTDGSRPVSIGQVKPCPIKPTYGEMSKLTDILIPKPTYDVMLPPIPTRRGGWGIVGGLSGGHPPKRKLFRSLNDEEIRAAVDNPTKEPSPSPDDTLPAPSVSHPSPTVGLPSSKRRETGTTPPPQPSEDPAGSAGPSRSDR